jgi:hypothetical protein
LGMTDSAKFWIPETAGTSSDGAEPFISYT